MKINHILQKLNEKELLVTASLKLLRKLITKYPCAIPADFCIFTYDDAKPQLYISCSSCPNDEGKAKLLSHIGDSYGRDSWVRIEDRYAARKMNWQKELDGVIIHLAEAEIIPPMETPVAPSLFPLLLEDREI